MLKCEWCGKESKVGKLVYHFNGKRAKNWRVCAGCKSAYDKGHADGLNHGRHEIRDRVKSALEIN